MENLNRTESTEFLEIFLKGLLEESILEPLQKLEKSEAFRVKGAAQSLSTALITGVTPEVAVVLMSPRFPPAVELLIINGFEQSNIDFVLKDIISAYKSFDNDEHLTKAFGDLLERYSSLKTEAICIECWTNELQKLFKRAHAERSAQVILSWEKGHLVQKYIATKLVTVTESAVPAVYGSLKNALRDLAELGAQNSLGIEVTNLSKNRYQMTSNSQSLTVSFLN